MIIARSGLSVLALALTSVSSLASMDVDQRSTPAMPPPRRPRSSKPSVSRPSHSATFVMCRQGTVRSSGCVSGPEQGAMGVHFVNPTLLVDDTWTRRNRKR